MENSGLRTRLTLKVLVLALLLISLQGCEIIDSIVRSIKGSSLSNRTLHVLVIPPMNVDESSYSNNVVSSQIHELMLEAMVEVDRAHNYYINSYKPNEENSIRELYAVLINSNDTERKKILNLFLSRVKADQIIFGRFKANVSKNTIGLTLFLYDGKTNTIGKEPSSGFRWVRWHLRGEVSEHIGRIVRDLIYRNF